MGEDVGILGIEIYFPTQYVEQSELEKFDGVSEGKYTKGLGQTRMGFCAECEDAISMALTVTKRLLEKYHISPAQVGRLEVGTESGIDRSKSIKSYLMQLFGDNHDVCGLDTVQACFGGTQALFNAVDWLTSASWDGRLAIVVASDVATYPPGPARPTGGAGAVALLLGPNAPLIMEPRLRSIYAAHVYDFYKPNPASEYPLVDGSLSITSYLTAASHCYEGYIRKANTLLKTDNFGLRDSCGILFHSPYTRLVEKAFARLVLSDVIRGVACPGFLNADEVAAVQKTSDATASAILPEAVNGHSSKNGGDAAHVNGHSHGHSHSNGHSHHKQTQQPSPDLLAAARRSFSSHASPALWLAREVGNMYTPSLYACLVSYLANCHDNRLSTTGSQELPTDKRLLLFSYGSGLAAAMFSIKLKTSSPQFALLCEKLHADVKNRLTNRRCAAPAELVTALEKRHSNFGRAPLLDTDHAAAIASGLVEGDSFVLEKVDERYRRSYLYVPATHSSSSPPSTKPGVHHPIATPVSKLLNGDNLNSNGDVSINGMLRYAVDDSPLKNGYHHSD